MANVMGKRNSDIFFSFIRAGEESITEHHRAEERGREAEQEEMMLELGRNFEE